jgi:hypothetical protein
MKKWRLSSTGGRAARIGWRRDILETMGGAPRGAEGVAEGPEMEIHDPAEGRKHCTKNPIYVFPKKELCGLSPNSYKPVCL